MTDIKPIRVLIIDDTVMFRKILSAAVMMLPNTEVVGASSSGRLGLTKLEQNEVDLVLLDLFMPEMDGIETLKQIRLSFPGVSVVMVSGATTRDADITIHALGLGAIDFVPKPNGQSYEDGLRILSDDLRRILRVVTVRRLVHPLLRPSQPLRAPSAPFARKPVKKTARFELVVMGVSTGGPNALAEVIPRLPSKLGVPVLIVQHMPPLFTASLARHLAKDSALAVREAADNEIVCPDTVLIAPGGRHMILRSNKNQAAQDTWFIRLNDAPPEHSCRPAVDVLFRSVASTVPGMVLSVILTGMGEDGMAGVDALKRNKCYCLAQDEKTSVVYGMPRAVAEKGLVDEVLPLDQIAVRIAELVKC